MTWHGSLTGKFDPNIDIENTFKDHTMGIYAATSNTGSADWTGRIMATGGPSETNEVERSLPAAASDPQAVFDSFGTLYLTYLAPSILQFGTVSHAAGNNELRDVSREWDATNNGVLPASLPESSWLIC